MYEKRKPDGLSGKTMRRRKERKLAGSSQSFHSRTKDEKTTGWNCLQFCNSRQKRGGDTVSFRC